MKRIFIVTALILACAIVGAAQKTTDDALMKMEKAAWDAFGKGDGKFFETFLSDDSLVVMDKGFASKMDTVKDISSKPCMLKSYEFSNFKVTMLNANTALLTYHSTQDGTCGTQPMPAKVYASSIYVKRNGKWLAAFHQETPVM